MLGGFGALPVADRLGEAHHESGAANELDRATDRGAA